MNWLGTLRELWRGAPSKEYKQLAEKDREESQQVIDEAKKAIADTRAVLDGEDYWLIPNRRETCGGR